MDRWLKTGSVKNKVSVPRRVGVYRQLVDLKRVGNKKSLGTSSLVEARAQSESHCIKVP